MKAKTVQKFFFIGAALAISLYIKNKMSNIFDFGKLVVLNASKYLNIREIGRDNKGFNDVIFQSDLAKIGWKIGQSWCCYFCLLVYLETYKNYPKIQTAIKKIIDGSTQKSFLRAQTDKTKTFTTSKTPKVGDIAIWQNVNNTARGHAAIVIKVNTNTITTIEGNTSVSDIADGDTVAKQERPKIIGTKIQTGSNLILRGYIRKL